LSRSSLDQPLGPVKVAPRERSLLTIVYETIEAMVLENILPAGSRINIEALARQMEVSPTPVRESLGKLEATGLVQVQGKRGYIVMPMLSRQELTALFEFRILVEPWAAARAAELATGDDRARIKAELESAGGEAPPSGDYAQYSVVAAHDARFHDLISEASGNQWIRDSMRRTNLHLHLLRIYYSAGIGTTTITDHRKVAKPVVSGNPEAAERAMRNHLVSSSKRLLDVLT
jgi:DNA-binding GntR family transcriptional regulator